jgi:hypothetical protein
MLDDGAVGYWHPPVISYSVTKVTDLNTTYNNIRSISVCCYSPEMLRCVVSEVVVGCEVNPPHGCLTLCTSGQGIVLSPLLLPSPAPAAAPHTLISTLSRQPSHLRVSVSFSFVCSCSDIQISEQNIKTHTGYLISLGWLFYHFSIFFWFYFVSLYVWL